MVEVADDVDRNIAPQVEAAQVAHEQEGSNDGKYPSTLAFGSGKWPIP